MDFLYSDYHAGSCGFNPSWGSITHGQSNRGRIVSVILLAFSNPKVIASWLFKTFMLDKTHYSETRPLPNGKRRNSCKEFWFQRKGCYWHKTSFIVCPEGKNVGLKWQTHIGCTHLIAKSLVVLTRYIILNLDLKPKKTIMSKFVKVQLFFC